MTGRPDYEELRRVGESGLRTAWGVYGEDDQRGALNLLTEERVRAAAGLVRQGRRYPLAMPLDQPNPPFFGRKPFAHTVEESNQGIVLDDWLDGFYPQAGTQWDAFAHFAHPTEGFYNGHTASQIRDEGVLGIHVQAREGIVARGVLLDVARWAERNLPGYGPEERCEISAEILEQVCEAQDVRLEAGDVLCVRTGWLGWYLALDQEQKQAISARSMDGTMRAPGLAPADGIARMVWNNGVVALALDNPGVEPFPPPVGADGLDFEAMCHVRVMALLGVQLGEFFNFEALAADCAEDGRYDFLLTSMPLDIPGGIGSPPNAMAIR